MVIFYLSGMQRLELQVALLEYHCKYVGHCPSPCVETNIHYLVMNIQ